MNARDFLKQRVSLFQGFSDEHLKQLAEGSSVRSFEAHEAIAHHGAEATHFGVILSGTVSASVPGEGGAQILGQLKAGETFGELALMTGEGVAAARRAEDQR